MCGSFAACSSDDDDEGSGGGAGRRISTIRYGYIGDSGKEEYDEESKYEYDKQGRIVKETYTSKDGYYETITYQYNDATIVESSKSTYGTYTTEYVISNGKIVKETDGYGNSISYKYDGNRLKSISDGESTDNVVWDGNNIKSIQSSEYTYSDIQAEKGWTYYHNINAVLYNSGYYGDCSQNLIETETRYGETVSYKYEIGYGYVKSTGSDGSVAEYVWE